MLPDHYKEDPFPINFSEDELLDYYFDVLEKEEIDVLNNFYINMKDKKDIQLDSLIQLSDKELENLLEVNEKIRKLFMNDFFSNGIYGFIDNAYNLLQQIETDPIVKEIFDDFELDLSHMNGMSKRDMSLLVLPFKNIEDAKEFGYMMRKRELIFFFENGELLFCNMDFKFIK